MFGRPLVIVGTPNQRNRVRTAPPIDVLAHVGVLADEEDPVDGEERPHLGAPPAGQHAQPERPAQAAAQVHVDRRQADADEHRVRLGAHQVVEVVLDARAPRRRRRAPAAQRRPPVSALAGGQPVGDAPAEHRARQRDRHRGEHPQVQRPVPEQRIDDGEDEGERLPRRRAAEVQRAVQGVVAPVQPAVGVIAGTGVGPPQDDGGHQDDAEPDQPPRGALQQRAAARRRSGSAARNRGPRGRGSAASLAWCQTRGASQRYQRAR